MSFSNIFSSLFKVANNESTDFGRRKFGWIRLGRVKSKTTSNNYVLAVRMKDDTGAIQLGCSCPDWIYRKSVSGAFCRHQKAFLAHKGGTSPTEGIWFYNAGAAFVKRWQELFSS